MPARLNLPNTLTWIRIILIPLIVLMFYARAQARAEAR
jgi:phosphatidylglycerophosphate synthase